MDGSPLITISQSAQARISSPVRPVAVSQVAGSRNPHNLAWDSRAQIEGQQRERAAWVDRESGWVWILENVWIRSSWLHLVARGDAVMRLHRLAPACTALARQCRLSKISEAAAKESCCPSWHLVTNRLSGAECRQVSTSGGPCRGRRWRRVEAVEGCFFRSCVSRQVLWRRTRACHAGVLESGVVTGPEKREGWRRRQAGGELCVTQCQTRRGRSEDRPPAPTLCSSGSLRACRMFVSIHCVSSADRSRHVTAMHEAGAGDV